MTSLLLLGAVAFLVAVNGFFVAAEFALVRARRARVETLAGGGARGARLALQQIERIDEYLSSCQLGITMASLGIGFLGEPSIARLLEEPLGNTLGHTAAVIISLGVAYLIVTAAHITVGEQVPKIYAIVNAEATVRFIARPLEWFHISSRPLGWTLNRFSNGLLRLVGVDPRMFHEAASSGEELRLLIAESATGGVLDSNEADMLHGVFDLHERQARQVMTPFHTVVTVTGADQVEVALERALESGHTRLVVIDADDPDRVLGAVHTNSLVKLLFDVGPEASLASAVRPVHVVPETKSLDDLLADLQRERTTLAVVADEYGALVGIVTVEDIIEEIVGEIVDETDNEQSPARRLDSGDWLVRGDLSLDDLKDYGIDLPASSDNFTSVGGLVFDALGRLPEHGDVVRINGYSLHVETVKSSRIESLRIHHHEPLATGKRHLPT